MSLLKNIFGSNKSFKECPRCIGKGHVDWTDIKRLNQELKWIPGTCAYCNGSGKVDNKIEDKVPVDASYLVINLHESERRGIINGHPDALERGKQFEEQINTLINQIGYLHFEFGLTPTQIAEFFLMGREDSHLFESKKQDFIDYAERVIKKKESKS